GGGNGGGGNGDSGNGGGGNGGGGNGDGGNGGGGNQPDPLARKNANKLRNTSLSKALTLYKSLPVRYTGEGDNDEEREKKEEQERKIQETELSSSEEKKKGASNLVSDIGDTTAKGLTVASSAYGHKNALDTKNGKDTTKGTRIASVLDTLSATLVCAIGIKKIYDTFKDFDKAEYTTSKQSKVLKVLPLFLVSITDLLITACRVAENAYHFGHADKNSKGYAEVVRTRNLVTTIKNFINSVTAFARFVKACKRLDSAKKGLAQIADKNSPEAQALSRLKSDAGFDVFLELCDSGVSIALFITYLTSTFLDWKKPEPSGVFTSGMGLAASIGGAVVSAGALTYTSISMTKNKDDLTGERDVVMRDMNELASNDSFIGTNLVDGIAENDNVTIDVAAERMLGNPAIANKFSFLNAYVSAAGVDLEAIASNSNSQNSFSKLILLASGN
ncbi:MAG: hypothetical protein R3Y53_09615, partial [Bacillota bacterium]